MSGLYVMLLDPKNILMFLGLYQGAKWIWKIARLFIPKPARTPRAVNLNKD